MTRKDWTLLALHYAGGTPLPPVKLQKALFLLGEQFGRKLGDYYTFVAHYYGPFDPNIYRDVESLVREGLAVAEAQPGRSWFQYYISPHGVREARRVQRQLPKDAVQYLKKVIQWILPLTFEQIVRTIYRYFPEYGKNSVFQS